MPSAATATATAALGCVMPDGRKVADVLKGYVREWDDADKLANSTSRIALSQPVATLQGIERRTEAESLPLCGNWAQRRLVSSMTFGIDGYLAFMRQEPDATVAGYIRNELSARADYDSAILAVMGLPTPTPVRPPTATVPPAYGVPTVIFATATSGPPASPSPTELPPTPTRPAKLDPTWTPTPAWTPTPRGIFGP